MKTNHHDGCSCGECSEARIQAKIAAAKNAAPPVPQTLVRRMQCNSRSEAIDAALALDHSVVRKNPSYGWDVFVPAKTNA